jgi:hypothetical protein
MKKNIMAYVAACLAIFVATPWIPTPVVNFFVGNYVMVFVILAFNLYLLRIDAVLSLTFFLVAGSLFLENRKRTLAKIESSQLKVSIDGTNMAPVSALSVPAGDLIDGETHPEHETPSSEDHPFEPTSEGQSNSFHKVGLSINEKHVIPTEEATSAGEMADKFIKAGFVL